MNAYQSIKKIHHAASTPGVVASGTATPGGIIHHPQKGLSLYDDESSSVFERNFKISEIINPDGSVSIRRKIINPDGSSCIREEEYCDLKKISSKTSEVPNLQLSDSSDSSFSSLATVKTKGSSAIFRTNPREEMQQRSFVDARSTQSDSSDSSDISYLLSSNAKDMMKSVQIEEHPRNRVDTMSSQSDEDRSSSNANEIFKTYQRGKQQRRNRVGNQWAQADSSDSSNISYLHSSDKSSTFKPTAGTTHLKKTSELHTQQWLTGDDGNFGRNEWPFCTTRPMNPVPFEDVKRSSPKPSVSKRASSASLSGNSNAANSHSIDGYSTMSFSSNAQEKPRTRPKLRIDRPLLRAPNVEKPVWQSSDTVAVTVKKEGAKDKIGINVGLKDLACGVRLVVSKISPNGKFANSPIEMGDIVVSINGKKFLENPNPEDALAIVRNEKSKITIVVQKRGEIEDCGSLDGLSRSLSYEHGVREIVNPDMSKTVTREVWHEDGSRTTIVEDFDEGGSKINKKTRTYKMGSDGSINVSTDEQAGRPSRLFSNGPLNVFGDMSMTVLKKSRSQKVGISLMTRETPNGNVLFVSHIDPVGLFAKTPLRVGDTILSVNEFNFRNNPDAKLAFCVIQGVSGDLTIVARKSEQRGEEFLLKRAKKKRDEHRRTVQTIHIPAPKLNEREFDEESYGACMDGYNSSRIFAVTKMNPNEDFGIKMVSEGTAWGTLLLISEISPSRRLSATDLKIGDAVLAINGVCFRDDPDENRAAAVLRDSRKHIVIEYQPLSIMKPALRPAEPVQPRVTQIVKPDGVRCVRTETINPDGSTTVKVEEFAPIPDHVPIERTDSDISGLGSVVSGMSTWVDPRERSVKIFEKSDSDSAKSIFVPEVVPLNSDVVRVTVTKRNPKEEVGISVHTLNGALYVSKVSPTGLLVGKPILPGDIILSINNENFRKNPNAKDAFSLILHARDSVTFEVLKMSNNTIGRGIDGGRKLGFCKRLMCSQRVSQQKQSNSYFDPFYV